MGRWSRALAPRFLEWARVPKGGDVLDVGCGTGALSQAALDHGARSLAGIDLAPAHVEDARWRLGPRGARFEVASAQDLPFPDASFDAVVSGLVLNFVPDPAAMAREMRRVARPGGVVALYVWDYAGKMEMMRHFWDAAVALDPAATAASESSRFAICEPRTLERLFGAAGLRDVRTDAIDQPQHFPDFDALWRPFLGGQGPAPGYVAKLDPARREALRQEFARRVPAEDIHLVARAWAVAGVR